MVVKSHSFAENPPRVAPSTQPGSLTRFPLASRSLEHWGDANLRSQPKFTPPAGAIPGEPVEHVNFTPTPIFFAVRSRNPEIVKILVKAGADLNVRITIIPLALVRPRAGSRYGMCLQELNLVPARTHRASRDAIPHAGTERS